MAEKNFKEQIESKLQKLNGKQVVFFAWLCAVRTLPFMGVRGSFGFWGENRKKHLYAVFRALDVNCYVRNYYDIAIRDTAYAARDAIRDAVRDAAYGAAAYPLTSVFAYAAYAANVANVAYAAVDAAVCYPDYLAANAAANAAANFAANAATNFSTNVAANFSANAAANFNIKSVIFRDLKKIENGQIDFENELHFLGDIWDNFQHALAEEGCAYWGRLYQDIFENGFKLDEEALKRRMNVPKEIQVQGAEAVAHYLEELEKGAKHLNEARIIILGEKGAGKTCLARRLKNPDDNLEKIESTPGVETTLWELKKDEINVHIWDFAGHVVTHAAHQFFLSERCLYILVYDGRTENRNQLDYWLNHAKNYGKESKVYILVNTWKEDPHTPCIPINSLIKDKKYPIEGVYTFSIREDYIELEDFRKEVTEFIKNNPSWSNQVLPANYFNVKKELELLFAGDKKEEYIDIDKFSKIAKRNKVDDIDGLLRNLHALGICLRYENMGDFDTLVLNPEWISYGIYKIINWVHERKEYSISLSDLSNVFNNEIDRYPVDKHQFLFKLMKHYKLAYEAEDKSLIIPHLLHEDRPEILPDFPVGESLMIRYVAEQPLPIHTISRFIVQHNKDIKEARKDWVWRYGVVLEDGKGSTALVKEEKENMISASVKGKDKTAFYLKVRESLNDIFKKYESWDTELQYRIERFGKIPDEIEEKNPIWLSDKKINNHYINNRPIYDDYTNTDIPVNQIVKNYHIDAEKVYVGDHARIVDKSVHNTFNFHNCNIDLQGNLNDLARLLKRKGATDEAEELEDAAKALAEVEQYKTPEEVKKKGVAKILKRIIDELEDDKSMLNKTVRGIKNGINIAQDIFKGYNAIAGWLAGGGM